MCCAAAKRPSTRVKNAVYGHAAVVASVTSAMCHFAPDADAAEVRSAASCMIIMGHGVLSECLVTQADDAARLLRMFRLSVYAIATAILLPVKR